MMAGPESRILFVTRDFPPVQHSGTLRSEAFTKYLPEYGISPVVLTSSLVTSESVAGLDVHSTDVGPDDGRLSIHRIPWSDGRIGQRSLHRLFGRVPVLASWAERNRLKTQVNGLIPNAEHIPREKEFVAIYASAPPRETIDLATTLGNKYALPVIADLRDLRTFNPSPPFRHWVDFKLAVHSERKLLQKCAKVIVNTKIAKRILSEEFGVPTDRIALIYNGYDEEDFASNDGNNKLDADRFVVVHAGQLSLDNPSPFSLKRMLKRKLGFDYDPLQCDFDARSPKYVIAALEQLIDEHPEVREQIQIWFVGMNSAHQSKSIQECRYPECLKVVPRVDAKTATDICCRANLLLLMQFQFTRGNRDCCIAIPAKLFSYLRTGNRILACVQPSEIADIVQMHDAGTVAAPTDVSAISRGLWDELQRWRDRHRVPSQHYDISQYDRRYLTQQLAETILGVVSV